MSGDNDDFSVLALISSANILLPFVLRSLDPEAFSFLFSEFGLLFPLVFHPNLLCRVLFGVLLETAFFFFFLGLGPKTYVALSLMDTHFCTSLLLPLLVLFSMFFLF